MSSSTEKTSFNVSASHPSKLIVDGDVATYDYFNELSTEGTGANTSFIASSSKFKSLLASAILGANFFYSNKNISDLYESETQNVAGEVGSTRYIAELKSWLKKIYKSSENLSYNDEFIGYVRYQLDNNFNEFVRALKKLSIDTDKYVPDEAVAQLLIDSSELAEIEKRTFLGNSIENYLSSESRILIDAAAKSLAPSRLSYVHAAEKIGDIAEKTKYRYLKRKLKAIHEQLIGQ